MYKKKEVGVTLRSLYPISNCLFKQNDRIWLPYMQAAVIFLKRTTCYRTVSYVFINSTKGHLLFIARFSEINSGILLIAKTRTQKHMTMTFRKTLWLSSGNSYEFQEMTTGMIFRKLKEISGSVRNHRPNIGWTTRVTCFLYFTHILQGSYMETVGKGGECSEHLTCKINFEYMFFQTKC